MIGGGIQARALHVALGGDLFDLTVGCDSVPFLQKLSGTGVGAYRSPRQPPTDGNETAVCNIGVNFRMNMPLCRVTIGAQTAGVSE